MYDPFKDFATVVAKLHDCLSIQLSGCPKQDLVVPQPSKNVSLVEEVSVLVGASVLICPLLTVICSDWTFS